MHSLDSLKIHRKILDEIINFGFCVLFWIKNYCVRVELNKVNELRTYSFKFQTQIISRKFSFSHSYWPSNYPRPNPPERRVQSPVICLLSHTITPFDKTTVTRLVFNEYCAPKVTALKTETERPKSKVWILKLEDQRPEPEGLKQKPKELKCVWNMFCFTKIHVEMGKTFQKNSRQIWYDVAIFASLYFVHFQGITNLLFILRCGNYWLENQ